MPDEPKAFSFNLPDREQVTVYLVKLADGRTVARTAEELAQLPEDLRGTVLGPVEP